MAIILPNVFQDGVNEVISGVQVNEDLNVLKAAIEVLEVLSPGGAPGARTERNFGEAITPGGGRKTMVTGDVELHPAGGFGAVVTVKVAGVEVQQLFVPETGVSVRMPLAFMVPAGDSYEVVRNEAARAGSLHTSHTPS
jgi:hypothetical protein